MSDIVKTLHYDVDPKDFDSVGEASGKTKNVLRQLGFPPEVLRRVAIAMYEGEINMVIHANGGTADVEISPKQIKITLKDNGPGIPDIEKAMQKGYSTASEEARSLGFGAGMGLFNMDTYADELNITTKIGVGTTVEMIIRT